MIDAGLPLVQCLDILGQQQENKTFQKIILQVRQDVEGGSSLAEAMRKHPQAFDDLYVNMVAAGEAGGPAIELLLAVDAEQGGQPRAEQAETEHHDLAVGRRAGPSAAPQRNCEPGPSGAAGHAAPFGRAAQRAGDRCGRT